MRYKYYIIYKPYLMHCRFTYEKDQQCLSHLNFCFPKDVYPVGRLDADSEGLLILTNDKRVISFLFNNVNPHHRTYLVQVEGDITQQALDNLEKGVEINLKGKKYKTLPCKVEKLTLTPDLPPRIPPIRIRKNIPTSWIKMTLWEGKNRQVRKMTAAVGFPTLRLVRIAIGSILLQHMQPGDVREINPKLIYQSKE